MTFVAVPASHLKKKLNFRTVTTLKTDSKYKVTEGNKIYSDIFCLYIFSVLLIQIRKLDDVDPDPAFAK